MNVKTFLTSAAATAALVGTIGFAYAQTESTTRNPDGTVRDMTQPSGTTGNRATTPSPSTSEPMTNSTDSMSNNRNSTRTERAARADRN